MSNNFNSDENERTKKKYLALIILLGITNIVFIALWVTTNNTKNQTVQNLNAANVQNNTLESTIEDAQAQIARLEGIEKELTNRNLTLTEEDKAKKVEIQRLLAKYNSTKKLDQAEMNKLRSELEGLRAKIREYEEQISQLKSENENLNSENSGLKQSVTTEKEKNANLSEKNSELSRKVTEASKLRVFGLNIVGVKERWVGNKEVTTDKSNAVERIKVSYKILENNIAEPGERTIYLRVIQPDGTTIRSGENSSFFDENNQEILYTYNRNLAFENKEINEKFYWKNPNAYQKGVYTFEVYCNNYLMGTQKVTFR